MAVDPVSPAANYKEKELLEAQPTRPRRNSIEDQDTTRPRKRLATMGSTTPQGSSPSTDKEDRMDQSPRSTTLTPSSTTTTTMTSTGNPATTLATQAMDQTPDTPPQGNILEESSAGEEESKASPSIDTVNIKAPVDIPTPPANPTEPNDPTQTDSQEPIIISVEPEREPSLSPSDISSAPESPWQGETYMRSPEVEELEGMEEDEVLADSITVVGEDPERSILDQEMLNQMARDFALCLYSRCPHFIILNI